MNSDAWSAVFLLLLSGTFFWASFDIRETSYGQMPSSVWPRVILILLSMLSMALLVKALGANAGMSNGREPDSHRDTIAGGGLGAWFSHYRNAFACYGLFLLFLLSLPWLGMLIGGILFVFGMLSMLGGWALPQLWRHALIAVLSVGAMWAIFTFGLHVILPQGVIFTTL